jgi:hypothetical protein
MLLLPPDVVEEPQIMVAVVGCVEAGSLSQKRKKCAVETSALAQ